MKEHQIDQVQTEVLAAEINTLLGQMAIGFIKATAGTTRSGLPLLSFSGQKDVKVSPGSGLESLVGSGNSDLLFKFLARTLNIITRDVSSLDLLGDQDFVNSCASEIRPTFLQEGNLLLNQLAHKDSGCIPVFYGSTSGINFAEVLETITCAKALEAKGLKTYTLFDHSGHVSSRSTDIFEASCRALPVSQRGKFTNFIANLGNNLEEQRINATKMLAKGEDIIFTTPDKIAAQLGSKFTLGKLALLAKVAGNDPLVFGKTTRASDLLKQNFDLTQSVAEFPAYPAGFTFYARDAVLARDIPGIVGFPLKLTTHANIYKILGGYGGLISQRGSQGAILLPITRQRIQTGEQATRGTDPCDVTIMAFLAQQFPKEFAKLVIDFTQSCQVLTPAEALTTGTDDKRFIIQNYFPISI